MKIFKVIFKIIILFCLLNGNNTQPGPVPPQVPQQVPPQVPQQVPPQVPPQVPAQVPPGSVGSVGLGSGGTGDLTSGQNAGNGTGQNVDTAGNVVGGDPALVTGNGTNGDPSGNGTAGGTGSGGTGSGGTGSGGTGSGGTGSDVLTTTTTKKPTTTPTIENREDRPGDGCEVFTPNAEQAPVYIQVLNQYESVLMPKEDLVFMLRNEMKIIVICPSTFTANESLKTLTLTCKNNKLVHPDESENSYDLMCKSTDRSELYLKNGDTECQQTLYALGLNITGQIITYAEVCYDLKNKDPDYVHYKATKPSQFITSYIPEIFLIDSAFDEVRTWDQPDDRYVNHKAIDDDDANARILKKTHRRKRSLRTVSNQFIYKTIQKAILSVYSQTELPHVERNHDHIQMEIKNKIHDGANYLHFSEFNLFPFDIYEPFVKNPFENREFLQRIYGWNNLIFGNWRYFNKLLKLHAMDETFEVYTGTSHAIEVPTATVDTGCIYPIVAEEESSHTIPLIIDDNNVKVTVPKYFWTFIKAGDPGKSFVVIGINTPYYELLPDTMLTCNDMCGNVDWLEKLENFRLHDPFGVIHCCPVNEVNKFLKGFPRHY